MLIEDFETYLLAADKLVKNSKFIYISSFGFYAGIDSFGGENLNKQGEFCIKHNDNLSLLVGTSFTECHTGCVHCLEAANKKRKYLQLTKARITNMKIVEKLHMKTFLTNNGAIVGGINFTNSNWTDYCILLEKNHKDFNLIKLKFENEYKNAKEISLFPKEISKEEKLITFGKYKGYKAQDVAISDPKYYEWCKLNIAGFSLTH